MKRSLLLLVFTAAFYCSRADHITGGEMYYSYLGFSNGLHQYHVTLKLFMRCNSDRQFPNPTYMSIFDKGTNERIKDTSVAISSRSTISLTNSDPCISNPPQVCYEVAYYEFNIRLPGTVDGYLIASEVNFRIRGISNLTPGSQVGATYTCEIPGTFLSNGPVNNSAHFIGSDLVVVCANNYFSYSFGAEDLDGDQLQYSFCSAYTGSSSGQNGVPAGTPPYNSVPYFDPSFSESSPLGISVGIDPQSGLITGVAPEEGTYVVTVCVTEIRGGTVIATQRKDLQIFIAPCNVVAAKLDPDYMLCKTSRSISLTNQSTSPLILSQLWTVYDPAGTAVFSSIAQQLDYTFPINGKYLIRLIINKDQPCTDTAFSLIYVFPGLVTDFSSTGICLSKPTVFTDRTTLISGAVNSWTWDFGETGTTTDVSQIQHPAYTYLSVGDKSIRMLITTTDGCRDTLWKSITIIEKPPITLAFRDTLICLNDRLQLNATGIGNFSWAPIINITNPLTPNPTVAPVLTQKYFVHLDSDGCINDDSVLVRVVDHVSLQTMPDTLICTGDNIILRINSDGLKYLWTPASQLDDATIPQPIATTPAITTFIVTATIGGCSANGTIVVTPVPYPIVNAGKDTAICYNSGASLHLQTNASNWQWSPSTGLNDPRSLHPTIHPAQTTTYIAIVQDPASGCPKPSRDTVVVTVLPKIRASAGRDTAVVVHQPLQLHASGGEFYAWYPLNYLSDYNSADPFAIFPNASDGHRYKVVVSNSAGCSDSAFVNIKVYATGPTVFVPSAFSPNNDGLNDRLKPTAVGMISISNFSIYNRWGQLVYSGSASDAGWDGRVSGQIQASNTYVWMVKAVDFRGKPHFQKGMVTLVL